MYIYIIFEFITMFVLFCTIAAEATRRNQLFKIVYNKMKTVEQAITPKQEKTVMCISSKEKGSTDLLRYCWDVIKKTQPPQ